MMDQRLRSRILGMGITLLSLAGLAVAVWVLKLVYPTHGVMRTLIEGWPAFLVLGVIVPAAGLVMFFRPS